MKTKSLIILIVILALAGLVFSFVYWSKNVKPSIKPPQLPVDLEKRQAPEMRGFFESISPPLKGGSIIEEK